MLTPTGIDDDVRTSGVRTIATALPPNMGRSSVSSSADESSISQRTQVPSETGLPRSSKAVTPISNVVSPSATTPDWLDVMIWLKMAPGSDRNSSAPKMA